MGTTEKENKSVVHYRHVWTDENIPLSGKWFVETMDGHRVEMCRIECLVEVKGDLTEVQKYQLLEIAYKCPVHRTLHSKMYVQTNISIIS